MDEEQIELLGALFDDELAAIDDELAGYDVGAGGDEVGAFGLMRRVRARTSVTRRGAPPPARALVARRNALQMQKAAYINKLVPALPGVVPPGARNFPLGFGAFTFVNAGVTAVTLTANPQRPYKGARLVIDITRSAGAVAELVTVTSLNIGQDNQLVSAAALPAAGFRPDATNTVLALDPATPGIDIVLGLALSATPPIGETITVSAMLVGPTIG